LARVTPDLDLAVLGGGPAGTACAIHAARNGARVLLMERGRFPRHKVCGEFISPEAVTLLADFGHKSDELRQLLAHAPRIARARLFIERSVRAARIMPAAASIARYDLDAALWHAAAESGAVCRENTRVESVEGDGPFTVRASPGEHHVRAVVNATGRWSNLTVGTASGGGEKWIGLKAHFREAQPPQSVDLYFFPGGYCGVQPVRPDVINACAMVRADAAATLEQVFAQHGELWRRSRDWTQEIETVNTSPLRFRKPMPVADGVLRAGDAAGFIDPFVGDGIALALLSGRMAAEALAPALQGNGRLSDASAEYARRYRHELLPAFARAARLRRLLRGPKPLLTAALQLLRFPPVAELVIRATRAR
jgi:flavin-dependent dehydrogenase